jgi:AcrR family transcriptional regulator
LARRLTRDENAAVTKRRLLKAARKVFLERGFHGASLDAVVEEAGFTKGAVYSRFESKADLYVALIEELNEERAEEIAADLVDAETADEVVEGLKTWFKHNRVRREPARAAFTLALVEFWTWAGRDPELRRRAGEEHERMINRIVEVVDEALARSGSELAYPTIDLVRLLAAISRGFALEYHISPEVIDDRLVGWAFDSIVPSENGDLAAPSGRAAMASPRST